MSIALLSVLFAPVLHMLIAGVAAAVVSSKVKGTARTLLWSALGVMSLGLVLAVAQFFMISSRRPPLQFGLLGLVSFIVATLADVLLIAAVGAGRSNPWMGGPPLPPAQGFPQALQSEPTTGSPYGPPPSDAAPFPAPPPGSAQPY